MAARWTVEGVAVWLETEGFKKYASSFVANKVTGRMLLKLTSEDLRLELGVDSLEDRKKLLAAIDSLHEGVPDRRISFSGFSSTSPLSPTPVPSSPASASPAAPLVPHLQAQRAAGPAIAGVAASGRPVSPHRAPRVPKRPRSRHDPQAEGHRRVVALVPAALPGTTAPVHPRFLLLTILRGHNLVEKVFGTDYFVQVYCGDTPTSMKTSIQTKGPNPVWNQTFFLDVAPKTPFLKFYVWDFQSSGKNHFLGVAKWNVDHRVTGGNLRLDLGPRLGHCKDLERLSSHSVGFGSLDIHAVWSPNRNLSTLPLFTLSA